MCGLACYCIVDTLNNERKDNICRLNAEEKKVIAGRIEEKFRIPDCTVIQDGTLLGLGIEPEYDDTAEYNGIIFTYSITLNGITVDER